MHTQDPGALCSAQPCPSDLGSPLWEDGALLQTQAGIPMQKKQLLSFPRHKL